jgi:hypothetical protein
MRIVIATLAAAAVAGLAFTADAAPSKKKQQYSASKERASSRRAATPRDQEFGYDQTPDHYPVGSNEWWRAMDREGRGGCCGTPN